MLHILSPACPGASHNGERLGPRPPRGFCPPAEIGEKQRERGINHKFTPHVPCTPGPAEDSQRIHVGEQGVTEVGEGQPGEQASQESVHGFSSSCFRAFNRRPPAPDRTRVEGHSEPWHAGGLAISKFSLQVPELWRGVTRHLLTSQPTASGKLDMVLERLRKADAAPAGRLAAVKSMTAR